MTAKMRAAIFVEPGRIALDEKPIPDIGPLDALMRITTTTICGTDVHILKGEYPVAKGLTIGHEPVGIDREARQRRPGLSRGTTRHRRRHYALGHELCFDEVVAIAPEAASWPQPQPAVGRTPFLRKVNFNACALCLCATMEAAMSFVESLVRTPAQCAKRPDRLHFSTHFRMA